MILSTSSIQEDINRSRFVKGFDLVYPPIGLTRCQEQQLIGGYLESLLFQLGMVVLLCDSQLILGREVMYSIPIIGGIV